MKKKIKTIIGLVALLAFTALHETTLAQEETVTDIDGNIYRTVKIGDQIWMAENLKTTRLNDGTPIKYLPGEREWANTKEPALCWYKAEPFLNDSAGYVQSYGFLYNWFTVGTEKLCPEGWHVPSDNEWRDMVEYLGGPLEAGRKMKETGTEYWSGTHAGVINESGFSARGAGVRSIPRGTRNTAVYALARECASWWSSSSFGSTYAIGFWVYGTIVEGRPVNHSGDRIYRREDVLVKNNGYSIRCIKTNQKNNGCNSAR